MSEKQQHWPVRGTKGNFPDVSLDLLNGSVVARADDGLVNSVCRVTTPAGDTYALRVFAELPHASAASRCDRETKLLATLADHVPVPNVIVADVSCTQVERPFVVYPWIEGITLNECRRVHGPVALQQLAHHLGRTLAAIAAVHVRPPDFDRPGTLSVATELGRSVRLLESSLARERLGHDTADALRRLFEMHSANEIGPAEDASLVHGDFDGRNIIVRPNDQGMWIVAGILDWESATTGSPLWDVGSLFRYARRYAPEFRAEFVRGYSSGGGDLPEDWWFRSRLLDATRIADTLNDDRDLGSVFDDCREIVRDLLEPTDALPR